MKNTWDEEVPDHKPEECYPCHGTHFYKLPLGCEDDGRECEDEDNCYCDCHLVVSRDAAEQAGGGTRLDGTGSISN